MRSEQKERALLDSVEPIVKTVTLKASPARAFEHFTKNIALWWPLATHSLSQADARSVVFETKQGGRIYEIDKNGREREWGRVLASDPPYRLVFSWVLEQPQGATEVEVVFEKITAETCELTLIHRGWEKRAEGATRRGQYDQGWSGVLAGYAKSLG